MGSFGVPGSESGVGSGIWDLEIWDLGVLGSLAHELDRVGWGEALLSSAVGGEVGC